MKCVCLHGVSALTLMLLCFISSGSSRHIRKQSVASTRKLKQLLSQTIDLHHRVRDVYKKFCSAANYRDEKCKEFSENISQQINLSSRRAIRTRYHHRNTTEKLLLTFAEDLDLFLPLVEFVKAIEKKDQCAQERLLNLDCTPKCKRVGTADRFSRYCHLRRHVLPRVFNLQGDISELVVAADVIPTGKIEHVKSMANRFSTESIKLAVLRNFQHHLGPMEEAIRYKISDDL